jgi:glycosyltransferase involved in cell wall biosynthesis
MRLLLLVDCYVPSTKSSATHIHDLAVALKDAGHDVVVAAPDETLTEPRSVQGEDGVTVLRVRTPRIKSARLALRALHEIRLSGVMWRAGREFFETHPRDLVVFYSPTIFFGPLVRRLKTLWRCRSYLILRDIFPQWAVDAGVLRERSLPHRYFRHRELEQYAAADVIGVQSPANLRYFEERGWSKQYRLEVLYNWAPASHGDLPQSRMREELGLAGKVVFFYGGNIGVAQDMDNVVRLAESVRDQRELHFLLVGDGREVPRLEEKVRALGLENFTIRPPLLQKAYLAALSEFDIGLISLDRGLRTQNFPGKMLGYMSFGIPILASINPGNDLRDVLESHEAGLVSENGADELFREHALRLARDPALRRRIGENGKRLLHERFSTAAAIERLEAAAGPLPTGIV